VTKVVTTSVHEVMCYVWKVTLSNRYQTYTFDMVAQADDAIELNDLQAQIDLSMSFARNLVTSWVNATHYTQTRRQEALEDEIKESMRRPARCVISLVYIIPFLNTWYLDLELEHQSRRSGVLFVKLLDSSTS